MADEKKDAFEEYKRTRDRAIKRWEDTKVAVEALNNTKIDKDERTEEHEDNSGM